MDEVRGLKDRVDGVGETGYNSTVATASESDGLWSTPVMQGPTKPYAFAPPAYDSMARFLEDEHSILFAHVGHIIEWLRMEVSGSPRRSVIARKHPSFSQPSPPKNLCWEGTLRNSRSKMSTRTLASTHQTLEHSVLSVITVRWRST